MLRPISVSDPAPPSSVSKLMNCVLASAPNGSRVPRLAPVSVNTSAPPLPSSVSRSPAPVIRLPVVPLTCALTVMVPLTLSATEPAEAITPLTPSTVPTV